MSLTTDRQARKNAPMARGLLDYFPNAMAAVASLSLAGSIQHGHGDDMHWEREKSNDHADCIMRHLVDRGTLDTDGVSHSVKVAWRALALAESELIAAGATPGRNTRGKDVFEGVAEEAKSAAENIVEALKVGDLVRIVRSDSTRSTFGWDQDMRSHLGEVFKVRKVGLGYAALGVELEGEGVEAWLWHQDDLSKIVMKSQWE